MLDPFYVRAKPEKPWHCSFCLPADVTSIFWSATSPGRRQQTIQADLISSPTLLPRGRDEEQFDRVKGDMLLAGNRLRRVTDVAQELSAV